MSDQTKVMPNELRLPRKKKCFMIESTDNGAWLARDIFTCKTYAYVNFDSMHRDMAAIMDE